MIDDAYHIAKLARTKRAGLYWALKHLASEDKSEDVRFNYLKGQYDALADVLGEIEQMHPGLVGDMDDVRPIVAPRWEQED